VAVPLGRVAEWQTRWLQVPVRATSWGFKSPLAHGKQPAQRQFCLPRQGRLLPDFYPCARKRAGELRSRGCGRTTICRLGCHGMLRTGGHERPTHSPAEIASPRIAERLVRLHSRRAERRLLTTCHPTRRLRAAYAPRFGVRRVRLRERHAARERTPNLGALARRRILCVAGQRERPSPVGQCRYGALGKGRYRAARSASRA
jgi:hypothetical protein